MTSAHIADLLKLGVAWKAYRTGIGVAKRKGDRQAARDMTVFARPVPKQRKTNKQHTS
jgi:hypothetical protein